MMQPPPSVGVTSTHPSPSIWRVSLDGKRVGTVYGDSVVGFTARDIAFHCIGRGYVNAEMAIQACVPVIDHSHVGGASSSRPVTGTHALGRDDTDDTVLAH